MSQESAKLCSRCHAKAATTYICYGGQGISEELCNECLAKKESPAAAFLKEMKASKCEFCGGHACSSGGDTLAIATGRPQNNLWMCYLCSQEYHAYLLKRLQAAPGHESPDDQIERLKKIGDAVAAHMKRYVTQRSN